MSTDNSSETFSHSNASYVYLTDSEWDDKISQLLNAAGNCTLCPRLCGINRLKGERGFCGAPESMVISSIFPHHGEEPPISGVRGSGTVFFSYCTLKCSFCQNFQISHEYEGKNYTVSELADSMLDLQNKGCHNINLVTPTHFLPWIVQSLKVAFKKGLTLPIVYNCSGYENGHILAILDGIVDIYLPDMKYGSPESSLRYSLAENYVDANRSTIRAMFRQCGPLKTDDSGIAYRGLCIRHLVLPSGAASSLSILEFLKTTFDPQDIFISLMSQYRPMYKADQYPEINRMVTTEEYHTVMDAFVNAGFMGFFQEIDEKDKGFIIDFKTRKDQALTGEGYG